MNDAVLSPPPQGSPTGPRALLEVFGCQMNKLDAELMVGALRRAGWGFTDRDEEADAVLLVTCSIRDQAEHRVHSHLGQLSRLKRARPELALGLLGCMAQREGRALLARWPALDFVAGTRDFPAVAQILQRVRGESERVLAIDGDPTVSEERDLAARPSRARAWVTVMRGCDKACTYCVVPETRGAEVSRPMREIVAEVEALVDDGVVEVTLLGQTVNAWGRAEGRSLGDLLLRLAELPALNRIRFTTSHPEELDDALIGALADCPKAGMFVHLPPQSGSDRMLRRMARGYTAARYLSLVERLRASVPGIQLGGDIIVGFPGETAADHEATIALMDRVRFSQAFVFRYSPRPGTPAFGRLADDVPEAVKRARLAQLNELQAGWQAERHAALVGSRHRVLVEGASRRDARRLFGRNVAFDRLVFEGDERLVDRFVDVEITDATPLTLHGRCLGPSLAPDDGARRAALAPLA